MRFEEWLNLRTEGDAGVLDAPMSRAGFGGRKIPHKEYKPKNFDRYAFKVDEAGASKHLDRLRKAIRNDVQAAAEALAGYYDNDAVVRALDDFLTDLSNNNIVL